MPEFLALSFMQRALVAGLMVAIISPAIGMFLVLRRLAQYGDALAHVSLAGVAAGMILRVYPVATGLVFAVGASFGIEWLRQKYQKYSELSVAIILSASLGLAVVLLTLGKGTGGEILSYLFGSIMTVTAADVYMIAALGVVVLGVLMLLYKEMISVTFDEEHARVSGLPVGVINTVFMVLTATTVAMSMRVVGVLLVSSLMVVPVAVALQVARSFRSALFWAVLTGIVAVMAGLVLSYYLNLAPGGTVVLTAVAILFLVMLGKRLAHAE